MDKKNRLQEVLRFVITGGLCFGIELGVLVLLKELLHFDTLIATPLAFLVSVIVNYLLCVVWVFKGVDSSNHAAQVGFVVTSLIGLVLNELLMILFRVTLGEETVLFAIFGFTVTMYMLNKSLATLIVMVWNYLTKRAILQSAVIARLIDRLHGKKAD